MGIKTYTALTLWVFSSAAFAWQPLTYPIRSQSAYQRSIDTAMCYATANKQTKVNIAHESQLPPRKPAATKTSSTGVPSRPPLPPSSFSAAPPGASLPAAAAAPAASAPVSTATANATTAAATKTASSTTAATALAASATTAAATPASATLADNGASETAAAGAASGVKLPPLPAPEPPMTQYWAAYGACMQARGYVVTQ
ncbi:hypothetical protein PQR05_18715 [Paraburkholderia sediminicola]|uniref:Uncharacterized protein n=1 Tax=Paraburkholderia metrosideri TaxID=580937 RepID=A0ABW9DK09_9BURK